ncbi:MAG: hypothetical protein HY080_02795 [Gammaproteobacteria bacterium]|nr:hypothetical protein [Gammaproteobacteria bacterium]
MDQLVTLPQLSITINGIALPIPTARLLGEIRIQQRLSLPTVCELTFIDPQASLAATTQIRPGDQFSIHLSSNNAWLFNGQITALEYDYGPEGQKIVRIRGYDKLHQLRKRQPVRAHVEVTLRELVQALVADLSLTVDIAATGPVCKKIVQYRQSDLELMTEIAERHGQYFILRDEVLVFCSLSGFGTRIPLTQGNNLMESRVVASAEPACRSVKSSGWDPWRAEQHSGNASAPRSGRQIALQVSPESFAANGERTMVDVTVQDNIQADELAQAELDRRFCGEVIFTGVARGDPRLQPGIPIEIDGLADPVSGCYVLTAVTHLFDHTKGYISILDTAPPERLEKAHSQHLATLGIVTRVDDPDGLGRMRVLLPNFNNIETDWLQVVIPGAGENKGVIALNTVDDRVLVLFINNDPSQALVLGGLYGTTQPPNAGVVAGEIKQYTLQLAGGQKIVLDQDKNTVSLNNGNGTAISLSPGRAKMINNDGSFIEMSRDKLTIHAKVPMVFESPGQPITLRGQSIDFVSG